MFIEWIKAHPRYQQKNSVEKIPLQVAKLILSCIILRIFSVDFESYLFPIKMNQGTELPAA